MTGYWFRCNNCWSFHYIRSDGVILSDNCTNVQNCDLRELSKRIAEGNETKIAISKDAADAIDKLIDENTKLRASLMESLIKHEDAARKLRETLGLENVNE